MRAGIHHLTTSLRNLLPGGVVLILAVGCGSNVRLDPPTIPEPLIESIPVRVVLRIPPEFESFTHEEEVLGNERWSIDLGRSNAVFFEQLFGYMFSEVTTIGAEEEAPAVGFDALIEPSIDAFEFAVPNQTKTDSFAVWIRYRIKVFDRAGKLVGNWPVSAYGKSLTTTMGGDRALRRAAVLAMRDAAALMIIRFDPEEFQRSLSVESRPASEDDEIDGNTGRAQVKAATGGNSE
jgi:hypothetical protein